MIKHIVMWKLKHELSRPEAAAQTIKTALESLQPKIPEILELEVGINISQSPRKADIVLTTKFQNLDHLAVYQQHPDHQLVVQEVVALVRESWVVDYHLSE